jgi:magnesium transporter
VIRTLYNAGDGALRSDLSSEEIAGALQNAQGLLWLDMVGEPAENCAPLLRDTFHFHPLAIEDALEESHAPKVNDWEEYIYLVLHAAKMVDETLGDAPLEYAELDIFVGRNYLVTHRAEPVAALDRVWNTSFRDNRHMKRGVAYLLYRLSDELTAEYMPIVDSMDDAIDRIEDEVFDNPSPRMLEQIFMLKRGLLVLRRIVMPQREIMNKLGRGDYDVIEHDDRVFFRDVYDQLVRLHDIIDSMRDLVSGTLDTYLSVVNNRLNDTMKTLTLITTLFMPLSFVAGFFGMNFFGPVSTFFAAWTTHTSFLVTLAAMMITPMIMYMWLRKRTPM